MPGWLLYTIAIIALWAPEPWRVEVTAYCPCSICCGGIDTVDSITASGVPALGPIIAAPKSIPFGTIIFVPGYGLGTVQDRGGAIRGDRLDVLFPLHWAARQWGRQTLIVLVWR